MILLVVMSVNPLCFDPAFDRHSCHVVAMGFQPFKLIRQEGDLSVLGFQLRAEILAFHLLNLKTLLQFTFEILLGISIEVVDCWTACVLEVASYRLCPVIDVVSFTSGGAKWGGVPVPVIIEQFLQMLHREFGVASFYCGYERCGDIKIFGDIFLIKAVAYSEGFEIDLLQTSFAIIHVFVLPLR